MEQETQLALRSDLEPLCPRDNKVMKFERTSVQWKDSQGVTQTLPSYHCGYFGCSVRYEATDGYFSIIDEPDLAFFLGEPAANVFRCPRHGTWLYRTSSANNSYEWRCGLEGCDYVKSDAHGTWLRQ